MMKQKSVNKLQVFVIGKKRSNHRGIVYEISLRTTLNFGLNSF